MRACVVGSPENFNLSLSQIIFMQTEEKQLVLECILLTKR